MQKNRFFLGDGDVYQAQINANFLNCFVYFAGRFSEAVDDMKKALALQSDLEPAQKCLQQSLKDLKLKDEQCGDQS